MYPGENCGDISRLLSRSIAAEISRYFTRYAAIYRDTKIASAIAPRYFRDSMIAHIARVSRGQYNLWSLWKSPSSDSYS